jgi:hypothetical protein
MEAVATATLFGGTAIALAWWVAPHWRQRLRGLIVPMLYAYATSAIILSPYLYYFFAFGQPMFSGGMRQLVSVHPSNFLTPPLVTALGALPRFQELSSGHIYENGAYIALPLLLIVLSWTGSHWQEWRARMLISLLAEICVASMGSPLNLAGHGTIRMPWAIAEHLPLMDKALPGRFSIYAFLVLGIILCLWLSEDRIRKSVRVAGACGVVLFTLPNLSAAFWTTSVDTPAFFSTGEFKRFIAPGDNLLVLPYGLSGNSDIWQATSGLYFRLAGGYVGQPPVPNQYVTFFPIVYALYNLADFPSSGELLKTFLAQKHVNGIVVADSAATIWRNRSRAGTTVPEATGFDHDQRAGIEALFATLGVNPIRTGGVVFYRVPLQRMSAYSSVDPSALQARIASAQLDAMTQAAWRYVSEGRRLADLNPVEVQRLGLIPPRWVTSALGLDQHATLQNGLYLTSKANGDVVVGVVATPEILGRLAGTYRPYANKVEIWPLINISGFVESTQSLLLLEFNQQQLSRAATTVHRQ